MKLGFLSLLGSSYGQIPPVDEGNAAFEAYTTDACMICEYTGVAETEAYALQVLAGKEAVTSVGGGDTNIPSTTVPFVIHTPENDFSAKDDYYNYAPVTILNPCAVGSLSPAFDEALQSGDIEISDSKDEAVYCVARFFVFHAKDIDRYVYGVKRYISTSDVSDSQVDISHYEGIKGWVTATQREHGATTANDLKPGNVPARVEMGFHDAHYAANPRFTIRGETKFNVALAANADAWPAASVDSADNAHFQVYAMDGREAIPSDQTSRLANLQPTTESVQSTPFTMCIVCSGSQEFKSQPTQSAQITDPCWNPSGSTVWKTDDATARDINRFCVPNNGLCKTSTWQYATKNSLKTTSYWVGIQRGCQDNTDGSSTGGIVSFVKEGNGYAHGIGRAADGMTKFVRYYAATNTAAKAKDNAKYPDAGSNTGSTVQTRPFAFDDGLVAADKFHYADASTVTTVSSGVADQFSYPTGATTENAFSAKNVYYFYGYVGVMLDPRKVADPQKNTGVDYRLAQSGFQSRTDDNQNNLHTTDATLAKVACKDITKFTLAANAGCVHSLVQTETPQFMSADGSGPPDLPAMAAAVNELECLSCVTPIDNTNNENNCVTAKTALTVKCKTLSCSAIVSNFKLENSDTADTYYYAKRGCTANPEDGVATGDQTQADSFVIPKGYTGIKQTNQRVTTKKSNTIQASSASVATIMDCYSCSTNMLKTVTGANPAEPTYDSIKTQDTSLCWQTFPPQADSSIAATGTSGRCETACFVSAYKYKETTGPATNPVTTFHWALTRGCAKSEAELKTGSTPSPDLYGVSITNYACDYKNGTLCNSQLEAYDTTLQLKTQTVRKIQCFICDTPAGNTDSKNTCYTVPSTEKATECPDLSYVGCFATETSFNTSATESVYGMKRGCSKGPLGTTESNVESYDNVKAKTTVCGTSSCNKVAGTTTGLVLASGSGISSPDSSVDAPADTSSDGGDDSTAEEADEVVDGEDAGETSEAGAAFISFTFTLLITLFF